jgi:hypothetical protein
MPSLPDIYENKFGVRVFAFGALMFILFVACAAFILFGHKDYPRWSIILGATWVVGVPIFFLVEHVFLFKRYGDLSQYEQFKRVQDLSAKIWATAILVLAACYAEQFPH